MHIVIGVLTALAGLIFALNKLQNAGVDLNAFSPFTWLRRRQWEKKLGTKPMHGLTDTMDAAAMLVVAVAKQDGEITRDTKMEVLTMFENEFGISRKKAIELFSSSTYLLNGEINLAGEVKNILAPTKEKFDDENTKILFGMLEKISIAEDPASTEQLDLIKAVKKEFRVYEEKPTNWKT